MNIDKGLVNLGDIEGKLREIYFFRSFCFVSMCGSQIGGRNLKGIKFIAICIIMIFSVLGCSNEDISIEDFTEISENRTLVGYVAWKEQHKILLVQDENFDPRDVNKLTLQQMLDTYKNYIFLGFDKESDTNPLLVGQKIKAWYDYIRESDPPKSIMLKSVILNHLE
jgi:hypothetical protein